MRKRLENAVSGAIGALLVLALVVAGSVTFGQSQGNGPFSPNGIRGAFAGDVYQPAPFHIWQNTINTLNNCNPGSSVSPAACGTSAAGTVVVPTTTTSYTVNTTAVTAFSRIEILPITDNSGLTGAPTCVAPPTPFIAYESGRTAGVSFSFTLPSTSGASCWTYQIVN